MSEIKTIIRQDEKIVIEGEPSNTIIKYVPTTKWVNVESEIAFLKDLEKSLSEWNNTDSDKVRLRIKQLEVEE